MLFILATSPWGLSKLRGGGVPTSYIYHSGPMPCRLLLRAPIELTPPSPPVIRCTVSPAIFLHPASAQDRPPTLDSPFYVPPYQENPVTPPSLTRHHQRPTLPLLPRPHHAWHILVTAAPTLLPKSLLACSSAAITKPSVVTTACATSPLPHILSPFRRPQILAVGPPTPLPSLASCWCIPEEVWFLSPGAAYPPPHFSKSSPPAFEPSSPSSATGNSRLPFRVFLFFHL